MYIGKVSDIVAQIADGLKPTVFDTMMQNEQVILACIKEQMMSGLDANGALLSPDYDNDPFFNEPGPWYHRNGAYKAWKREITPPSQGSILGLPPRPDNVPNLYINGKFYSEIYTMPDGDEKLNIEPGDGSGPDILAKYGKETLEMGLAAVGFFNERYTLPAIRKLFEKSGYKT